MSKYVSESVTWVGKVDWDLNTFHGQELSTHKGTTYNSYLIRDEKTVLVDTVWEPYVSEFVENLKEEIDLNDIDYIIANHAEIDHSGALPLLMEEIPNTPIYASKNGVRNIKGHFHKDWNFVEVKTGDQLNIGDKTLTFIEAQMLHWPDSMFCYLDKENMLFSNDAFGQHYASEHLFNDQVDQAELYQEALKYYANILTPFSALVTKKIKELQELNLPIDTICTSHGIIWRDNPMQIVEKYMEWAQGYQEDQITIIYDTMWEGTRKLAETICQGIHSASPDTRVKVYNSSKRDKNDLSTEIFKSKAVIIGSSTINKGILYSTAGLLEMIKGFKFKNKSAGAFGCYGWSGESAQIISKELDEAGFEVISPELMAKWNPDKDALAKAHEFGESFAKQV